DLIVSAAAYTAVDKAEDEPQLAMAVNGEGPGVLAGAAERIGAPVIHLSTDYVFDGSLERPWREDDPVAPLGVYGATKLAGEEAIRAVHPNHAIVRTAWVLSGGGGNFLDTMLRLAATREQVSVVDDQRGCPTNATDVALVLLAVAERLGARSGTWHFVNHGDATWHALAARIFAAAAERGLPTPELLAIPTAEYPTPARRPANSRLATARIERDFAVRPRPWQEAVDALLALRLDHR
ncbi:MAG: dTDP-4-dehydrorhamnose reductase, partial [Novosphingobium sp.]